ncbi:unnamed protein product [Lathyrus sativus]|nr:unnamed protein product [Lathyrus sativus]
MNRNPNLMKHKSNMLGIQTKIKVLPPSQVEAGNKIFEMLQEANMKKDGCYTKDEIKKVLKSLGFYFPGLKADRCMKKFDVNNDGTISDTEIDEFVSYLLN